MTYRFKLQEPIGQGVRRVGLEQIEIAEAKLSSKDNVSAAIHDARRCLKRVRAVLRLIQPGLEDGVYRREAERLGCCAASINQLKFRQHGHRPEEIFYAFFLHRLSDQFLGQLALLLRRGAA